MARKLTILSIICMLLVSALIFVSCNQEAGGGAKPGPAPVAKEKVENVAGEVSNNLVYNGNFDSGEDSDIVDDGSTIEIVSGVGIEESSALSVQQTVNYGEVMVDITKYYGRGKSYYVEGWFKNNGSTNTDDLTAYLGFSIVTGGGYTTTGQTWDIPGQYDGGWLSDDEAEEIFGIETNCIGESIADGDWHKVSAILDAEQIEAVMLSEDDKCHWTGDTTMYLLSVVFYVGTYAEAPLPGQAGYNYYLDNVVIKDLNKEIKRQGRTYEAPVEEDPEEEEEI